MLLNVAENAEFAEQRSFFSVLSVFLSNIHCLLLKNSPRVKARDNSAASFSTEKSLIIE